MGRAANDVTFFAVTDTHYGASSTIQAANRACIDFMNVLPGTAYPSTVGGGTVAAPRGLVITGDLTNDSTMAQWQAYASDYGVNGEGRVKYPVFDLWGNHDGSPSASTSYVTNQIKLRNTQRVGLTKVSTNGYHYSWDWDHVHFVSTNIYPGDVLIPDGVVDGNAHQPLYSLQFLKDDLQENVGDTGRPVVILMHLGLDSGWGATWWSTTEQSNFYNAIKNYNVIAILQGHSHAAQSFSWNGFSVYSLPSSQRDPNPGECFVFHITQNRLTLAHRFSSYWGSLYVSKAIEMRPGRMHYLDNLPDGASVRLTGKRITAKQGTGGMPNGVFYIEEPDRCRGIRVHWSNAVIVGNSATITGTLGTLYTGERYISATQVTQSIGSALQPYAVTGRSLMSPMLTGMLVRMAGKVTGLGVRHYMMCDGHTDSDGQPVQIRVETGATPAVSPGDMVTATGIASYMPGSRAILQVP